MKSKLFLSALISAFVFGANAQTIASFETAEGFATGTISEQNSWSLYSGTPEDNAVITTAVASDGEQSLGLISTNSQGSTLLGAFSPVYDDLTGSYEISQDIYTDLLDGTSGSNAYLYTFNYVSSLTVVSEVVFNYDGTILVYDETSTEADDYGYVIVGTFDQQEWYTVTTRYNDGASIDYYINGTWVYNSPAPNGTVINLFGFFFDDWTSSYFIDNVVYNAELSVDNVTATAFSVSPNPANSVITVSNADNALVNAITLTDINGREVKSVSFAGVNQATVNVSDLANGVYMMNITSDKGTYTKKIIKY